MAALLGPVALLAACGREAPPPEPVRAVRTMVVAAGALEAGQQYSAEIKARIETPMSFRVGGKLQERPVNLGDTVRGGQVLARLDPQDLRQGQAAADAALAGARATLAFAEADFKRFKELRDQGFISGAELDRRESSLKAARSQFDQARAQAVVQGNQADYSVLKADAPGIVTAVEAEPGTVVGAGTPIVRVAFAGPRDVVFTVPETQREEFRALIGQPGALQVRLWGDGATPFPAAVREVAASADPLTRTFLVKADAGRADVRLGQTATVALAAPPQQALKLPLGAVVGRGGASAVWLVEGQGEQMKVRLQPVQLAGADGNAVVVAAGVQAGQRVVTAGTHVLTAGQRVKLYEGSAGGGAR